MSCVACGYHKTDRCHIKSKGSGGSWEESNILSLCRRCHVSQHKIGWKRFCEKYPSVEYELYGKGWEIKLVFGIWKLVAV